MFSLTSSDRFYLYPYLTDMRKRFYTLSGIVTNQIGKDVQKYPKILENIENRDICQIIEINEIIENLETKLFS